MKRQKIESLQILRALAFLEIFLGHCGMECFSGSFGVSIFMILSGFCMAINYLPKANTLPLSPVKCANYGISKVKKLYGLHVIMLAITYVVVRMPDSVKAIQRLMVDLLLLKCWRPHSEDYYSYNGVAWYLSTYLFVCMMAPYVIRMVSKIKKTAQAVGMSVAVYGLMVLVGYQVSIVVIPIGDGFAKWLTYICPLYRLMDFGLGVLLGWIFLKEQERENEGNWKWTLLELLTVLAVIVFEKNYPEFKAKYMGLGYTAFWIPVSMLLVYMFAHNKGWITKLLNCRVLLWLGNISSLTFLIHQIVIRWLKMEINGKLSGNTQLIFVILCSGLITLSGAWIYSVLQSVLKKKK